MRRPDLWDWDMDMDMDMYLEMFCFRFKSSVHRQAISCSLAYGLSDSLVSDDSHCDDVYGLHPSQDGNVTYDRNFHRGVPKHCARSLGDSQRCCKGDSSPFSMPPKTGKALWLHQSHRSILLPAEPFLLFPSAGFYFCRVIWKGSSDGKAATVSPSPTS